MEFPDGFDPAGYFVFAVVRNPYEREVSHYRRRRWGKKNNYKQLALLQWPEYLKQAINIEPCQAAMLDGKPVSRVLRFENLVEDVRALPFTPPNIKVPHVNGSGQYDWRKYYSGPIDPRGKTCKLVQQHAARDFKEFDYDVGSYCHTASNKSAG